MLHAGMKSTLAFFAMLVGNALCAQAYRPLLDTSATWQDFYTAIDLGSDISRSQCYRYHLEGDTVVNDTAYKILRKTGLTTSYFLGPPSSMSLQWYSGTRTALLREDTAVKKVYIRELSGWLSHDELLYDFSAGLGPYPTSYRYPFTWLEVIAVDTVVLTDGPHRRMTMNTTGEVTEIIEGIGSTKGFLPYESWPPNFLWDDLVCHTTGGTETIALAIGPTDCACGSNVGMIASATRKLRVSPSPTVDLCSLLGAAPNAPYQLRSMDGRMVGSGTCTSDGSATIDMSGLRAAMYVVEVLDVISPLKVKVVKE